MDMQDKAMKEPQVKKLIEELFKTITETEEQAAQLDSRLVFVMQQEPPEVNEKDQERSGSCEMSDQLIKAIHLISRLGSRLDSMRKRLEI